MFLRVLLIAFPALLIGCGGGLKVAVAPEAPPVSALISDFKAPRRNLLDLSAVVELHLKSYVEDYNGEALLLLKREARLRVEPLDFFGRPLLYLTANPRRLTAYLPQKRKYYRGSPSPEHLKLWLGVPLELRHLVAILWADLPLMEEGARVKVRRNERDRVFELKAYSRGALSFQSLRVEMGSLNPVRVLLETRDGEQLLVQYSDYFKVGGVPLPGQIEVRFPREGKLLRLFYRAASVKLNRGLDDRLFELAAPPGVRIIPLELGHYPGGRGDGEAGNSLAIED